MRLVWLIFKKDLKIEGRAFTRMFALISFGVLAILLFSFSVGPNSRLLQQHSPGYLWLAGLFASSMLFSQSFLIETESDAIERLQLIPVSTTALFYGKALANTVQLLILMIAIFPPLVAICDVTFVENPLWLVLTIILGAMGIAAPGALYAAMTARLSSQQLVLPLLLFPLVVPALLASVKATSLIFFGDLMNEMTSWLTLLGLFDLIYWSLCGVLFDKIVDS